MYTAVPVDPLQIIEPALGKTVPLPDLVTVKLYVWIFAEQFAVFPPFTPAHVQDHGPEPVTEDAEPRSQRFVEGAVGNVPLLLLPHMPFPMKVIEAVQEDVIAAVV